MNTEKKRYQECNWFEKRIRDLWFITLPYEFITNVLYNKGYHIWYWDSPYAKKDCDDLTVEDIYSICLGEIDCKREYYITWDEIKSKWDLPDNDTEE